MKWFQISLQALLAVKVYAHTQNDENLEDHDLSLPDLATLDVLSDPTYDLSGAAEFRQGRVVMTPLRNSKGSLSSISTVAYDSWTIESIFRSSGSLGKTGGAFALKYENNPSDSILGKFDGLQVVVDSDGPLGSSIHAYLNDGTIDYDLYKGEDLYNAAIGSCLVSYQNSQVPNTLRIAYYGGVLVVQVNNELCLKTKSVKLPVDLKVAVSAKSGSKHEQFELLKLKTYGGVLSEVVENDNKAAPQPKRVTKYVQVDSQGTPVKTIHKVDGDNANEKHLVKQPVSEHSSSQDLSGVIDQLKSSNQEVLQQFESLSDKLNSFKVPSSGGKEADLSYLDDQNKKIKHLSDKITQLTSDLDKKITQLESTYQNEINKLVSVVNKLNNDNVNQLRDNEHSVDELNRKIEFLILSEKERQDNPISDIIGGLKYLIFPILIVVVCLSFFTYRLRHDIKTKLL